MSQKDVLSRLADAGEEALEKLAGLPTTQRMLEAANALRERVDELQKRVRSLDPLERRVAELERRLDELTGGPPKPPEPEPERTDTTPAE